MKLLLVSKKQITPGKASRAFRALEWLLLCVGTLVALEMLQASERTTASTTHVRSRFIGLWGWEVGIAVLSTI